MNEDRLEKLLDHYFDEALTPEEKAELESLLLSWPQARTLFWKRARFNALLRRRGREKWGRRLAAQQAMQGARRMDWRVLWRGWLESIRPVGWWAAAGLAAVLLVIGLTQWRAQRVSQDFTATELAEATAPSAGGQGIATILRAVEVQWKGNKRQAGNVLGPSLLQFDQGLVEVQFHRGARVVIEGPAEFELITDMQARCLLGKVRAEVPPPAIGFEILSPNVRVVDRGTAFGLEVQRNGPSEIHVFSGRVDLAMTRPPGSSLELLQGKAVRVDATGGFDDIPTDLEDFANSDTIEKRANSTMAARFAAWQAQSNRLRTDPELLVQYSFDADSRADRMLHNHAPKAATESNGTIIGCSWTEGRWPGKQALDFKQLGDRVRLALPRQHEALTCLTWVRLDALDRPYSALLMSGDAVVGELQWQFRGNGKLIFGKRQKPGWGYGKLFSAESTAILGPERCGSWMQLAFVYDAQARTLTHYLDGQQLAVVSMDTRTPLTTGTLEIGNWTPAGGDPIEPIRTFNGRMDEFLVFSRAMRADEIQQLWEAGRPL